MLGVLSFLENIISWSKCQICHLLFHELCDFGYPFDLFFSWKYIGNANVILCSVGISNISNFNWLIWFIFELGSNGRNSKPFFYLHGRGLSSSPCIWQIKIAHKNGSFSRQTLVQTFKLSIRKNMNRFDIGSI